ncbi:hypothetical protein M2401_004988 [Pseudomonas sp. JUb42]|nr:hypothetical protein [Pseudomonas sp. JUb42]
MKFTPAESAVYPHVYPGRKLKIQNSLKTVTYTTGSNDCVATKYRLDASNEASRQTRNPPSAGFLVSGVWLFSISTTNADVLTMTKKQQEDLPPATAADIERSIQALNRMAERLWGDGREAEAKALLDALDALNRALDRIRIGEIRKVLH